MERSTSQLSEKATTSKHGSFSAIAAPVPLADSEGVEALTGHKAELKQTLSLWALLALSYSNMSVWTAIGGSLSAVFTAGGPVVMVWSWVGVSIVSLAVAASLAELCSAWPHAAGQAFWAFRLSPPKWAPFLSYWTALFNIYGAWAIIAAGCYIQASETLAMAVAFNPDYVQKPSHLVGVYLGILVLAFICNVFAVRVFDAATKLAAGLSITAILGIIIALAVATPVKQDAKFVFTSFLNTTGWSSSGLVVLLGLLQSSFTIIGYDAAAHLAEEATDAARKGPLAVFWGVAISAVAGFAYILALLFAVTDVEGALTSATGSPLWQIFQDSMGLSGATFCMFLNIFSLFLAIVGILCASSRNVYAQARDKGLPFSSFLSKIHPTLSVPIPALLLNIFVPAVLVCIYLGSQVIFYAFFQLTTIGASSFSPVYTHFRSSPPECQATWPLTSSRSVCCFSEDGIRCHRLLGDFPTVWVRLATSFP
ncbi:choline transport protein, partial [Phenoliferia sp. Uapishka_3]